MSEAKSKKAPVRRTRIEDISKVGTELSEEQLRLVSGGAIKITGSSKDCYVGDGVWICFPDHDF